MTLRTNKMQIKHDSLADAFGAYQVTCGIGHATVSKQRQRRHLFLVFMCNTRRHVAKDNKFWQYLNIAYDL